MCIYIIRCNVCKKIHLNKGGKQQQYADSLYLTLYAVSLGKGSQNHFQLRTGFQIKQPLNSETFAHLKYIQAWFYYHTYILFRLRDNETVALMLKTCVGYFFHTECLEWQYWPIFATIFSIPIRTLGTEKLSGKPLLTELLMFSISLNSFDPVCDIEIWISCVA